MNNGNSFKDRIDKELAGVRFSNEARARVTEGTGKTGSKIRYLLNREIRIPVKPLAAAILIAVTGLVYSCFGITRVSAGDIQKSRIVIIENFDGRQVNDIYKD